MPKISVIMPSLNVAAYIRECMDSVLRQTLQDIEIICVDAGSTDGTLEILKEYAGKDRRIRLLTSAQKSYGFQMNLGIQEAVSEYVGIVETDDFVLPEMYEELYKYAVQNDADFVKSDFDVFTTLDDGSRILMEYSLKKYSGIRYGTAFSSRDFIDRKRTVDIFIWNGIYKRSFLLERNIRFQETPGAAFQDCGFRYQVVLNVRRGFFLNRSFYRYRRDNINSSTYNSRCVSFNLAECKKLIELVEKNGETDPEQMAFLAREVSVVALAPYRELLAWGYPDAGTAEALSEFRVILKDFIDRGILNRSSVDENAWLEIWMFVDNPGFYEYYTRLKAEITRGNVKDFLETVASQKEVVLFGCGHIGSGAYCFIRNNGINNVSAFCDNNPDNWDAPHMGRAVLPPEEAARRFPYACFIITNAAHSDEMRRQLYGCGIAKRQVMTCGISLSPMDCTNILMRISDKTGY